MKLKVELFFMIFLFMTLSACDGDKQAQERHEVETGEFRLSDCDVAHEVRTMLGTLQSHLEAFVDDESTSVFQESDVYSHLSDALFLQSGDLEYDKNIHICNLWYAQNHPELGTYRCSESDLDYAARMTVDQPVMGRLMYASYRLAEVQTTYLETTNNVCVPGYVYETNQKGESISRYSDCASKKQETVVIEDYKQENEKLKVLRQKLNALISLTWMIDANVYTSEERGTVINKEKAREAIEMIEELKRMGFEFFKFEMISCTVEDWFAKVQNNKNHERLSNTLFDSSRDTANKFSHRDSETSNVKSNEAVGI